MSVPAQSALTQEEALAIARAIRRESGRLDRRLNAIERDVARAGQARLLQHQAELLAHSRLPKRGAHSVEVIDYTTEPPSAVVIALDPALEPRAQVDTWFKTARRYLRGAELGATRAALTREQRSFLLDAATHFEDEQAPADVLLDLRADPRIARLLAAPLRSGESRAKPSAERLPYRTFLGHTGARILVGRGARDNDELTTRIARPQDLFLHVHDATGSHVIVPRNKGEILPHELLLDAAHLAHHFSGVAAEPNSEVAYVERRHVQKRKGSPAGAVHLLRRKVLRLVVEPGRLQRLLAAEARAQ